MYCAIFPVIIEAQEKNHTVGINNLSRRLEQFFRTRMLGTTRPNILASVKSCLALLALGSLHVSFILLWIYKLWL